MNQDTYTAAMHASLAECVAALERTDARLVRVTGSKCTSQLGEITRARKLLATEPTPAAVDPGAAILQAAQQMHDAADKLRAMLGTVGAVRASILLASLAYVRRGADDLEQFVADLAEDQHTALQLEAEDAESTAEELADKAARRAGCTRVA